MIPLPLIRKWEARMERDRKCRNMANLCGLTLTCGL